MNFNLYKTFLDELLSRLSNVGINVDDLEMDHIAIRTSSLDDYYKIKLEIAKIAKLKKENIVRGRPVDIYELNPKWTYKNYSISAIELVGPKDGDVYKTGFEHAEFVLKDGFESFLSKYPNLDWDTTIMNASEFPMIKLKLGDDMQVKFHLENVLDIIANEK